MPRPGADAGRFDTQERRELALTLPWKAGQSHVADFLAPDAILESGGTLQRNFRIDLPPGKKEWNRKIPHAIALLWGGVGGGGPC